MVEEVMKPIGYVAIYQDGTLETNGRFTTTLFKTWSSAVSAIKRSYGNGAYEEDKLRIVPVYL